MLTPEEEREFNASMGRKLHEQYKAAYNAATGTPTQRQKYAWAAVYLRAQELANAR